VREVIDQVIVPGLKIVAGWGPKSCWPSRLDE
jgi:hypothetical protein